MKRPFLGGPLLRGGLGCLVPALLPGPVPGATPPTGNGDMELDDLAADPGDARDQAAAQPTRAPALRTQLEEWRREVGAQAPVPNPPPRARLSQALP